MADISVIKLPDGTTYNLKDTTARSMANSAVPNTRTVNGKTLSSDISLGAGDVSAYTKSETDTKINAAVASAYKYKGSVTADKLPTSGQVIGDVYNITNDSSYGKAGMNVAWNGTTWDALGSNVDLSNYVTTSDSRLSNARPASDVYAWAKTAKKPSYSASEISGLGSLATKNSLSAGDVGLGNVANIDQSKAIKSITRSGTTFTATALDGTTSTFTQQDINTTYGLASQSSDGLMSATDKKAVDREFFRMLPKGGTYIPPNADLNTIQYLKVGNYYNSVNVETVTMKNCPSSEAFMMYVLSPLSGVYDNESTAQWVYRLRILIGLSGYQMFFQNASSGATAGSFNYGPWVKITNADDLGAVRNTINSHTSNKSNPHGVTKAQVGLSNVDNTADSVKSVKYAASAGSANSVAWGNVSGRPSSLPANGGDSATVNGHTVNADVPSGAKFTDTTYGAATQSSPGLMSAADKTKLDNLSSASTEGKEGVELTIPVSGWSSNTTAVNGTDYYTYSTTSITGISNPHPTIVCSSASGVLPSAEEKMAFDNIYFVTVDTSSSKITFYAPTKPNSTVVLIVKDFTAESTSSASANLTIATSDWSSSTTSINGAKYYIAKKTVNGINQAHPPVICHTASSSAALPSKAEQTAYNCIDYTTVDTSTNTITFYAMTKPSAAIALTMV